jgi:predicted nucleic acid-binding protein
MTARGHSHRFAPYSRWHSKSAPPSIAAAARWIVLSKGFKAEVGDALIAQSCINHDVALISRDRDFRHFVAHCGLKLA